jgi:chemotaxis protein methyltransferase CheR
MQMAVDLLTTNETFFFREPKHFDFLRENVLPGWNTGPRRVWSAASSSGEEAYTLAMVIAEHAPTDAWEIIGTDISTRVLEKARSGHYPIDRAKNIPNTYLTKYCLKGAGSQEGTFIVGKHLRVRAKFMHFNLKSDLTSLGIFDVIFLRNVLIYFDMQTKQHVVSRLIRQLKPGGYLMVGHSESLNGVTNDVCMVVPSVYRKP